MNSRTVRHRPRFAAILAGLALSATLFPVPAFAMKNRTIILRATGSGALLGVGAGLISYPFAKSTGTIIAGAFVGALLGTVYGFHLVDVRDENYRRSRLDELAAMHAERTAVFDRTRKRGIELSLPLATLEF